MERFALRDKAEVQILVVPVAVAHVGIAENVEEITHPGELILAWNLYIYTELVATYGQVVLGAEIERVLDTCLQTGLVPLAEFHMESCRGTCCGGSVVAWPRAFNLEERIVNPCGTLVRKRYWRVCMETVDGVVVVERREELEFLRAVPLVGAYDDSVLRGMLADFPEYFVLDFVPNLGIACGGFVQKFHHHAWHGAVAFCHVCPNLAGVLAGICVGKESLFVIAGQVKIVTRALVQIENHVQVGVLDVLESLVQQGKRLFVWLESISFEQIKVIHWQADVVEPRLVDALEITCSKEGFYVFDNSRKTDRVLFFDTVHLTEPSAQIHSAQSFFFHACHPILWLLEQPVRMN